jgi:polysaccharide export outer membrane protein
LTLLVVALCGATASACAATEVGYPLYPRDLIRISVQGESDVSVERRVDGAGVVAVPLLGALKVAGLTAAEVQAQIARRYVAEEIFVRPEVVVSVIEYAPKDFMVLGQVGKQGKQPLPPETRGVTIVEAITSAGGFTRIAKADAVRVTRKDEAGAEKTFTVDVEKMLAGRGGETFLVQPGDVVFVPERVF